jgi:D-sedoheptulose 7-phosphate isomerase
MSEPRAADLVRRRLGEGAAVVESMLGDECVAEIAAVAELTADAYRRGGKLLLFGNGGSAADAIHVAAELVGRYLVDRPAQPAVALVANPSSVTAIGNDYGYDEVFARQLRGLGSTGDVAMGFTTSGRSVNVEKALRAAAEMGLATVAMTGADPGPVGAAAEHRIRIPSSDTPRIQEGHMLAAHTICEWVEAKLVEESGSA